MRSVLSTVVELLGLLAVAAAAWLFDARLGLAVAGVVLVVVGFALDRPRALE